jgi:EmrB/QacA subfamily drug resistance transporter
MTTSEDQRALQRWTLALTSIAFFMVSLDSLVVITALPAIQRDLGSTMATLEWSVNAYTLAFAAGIITAAALGDRIGRRRVFAIGLGAFTAASAACALAPTVELLIAARTVQGIGAALVMPLSLTILTAAFPPERRGAIVGIWGGIAGVAVASGPLVGGAVTQGLDWHWIFWLNVPIGIVAGFFARTRLVESFGAPTRIDIPAVGLVTGGAVAVIWGLVRAGELGWTSGEVAIAIVLGLLLLAGFVVWEARAADPMLPLRLFRNPGFGAAAGTSFLTSAALISAAFMAAQFFQFVQGRSPFETGLSILPWTGTPIVVSPLAGALSDRLGRRPIMALGLTMQGVGLGWLAAASTVGVGYSSLVVPLIVAGVGVSMALPTTATAVMSAVAPGDMGKAAGVNSTLQRFGAAFGIAVVGAVFGTYGYIGTPESFDAGFRPALAVSAAFSLLGAAVALGVAARRPAASSAAAPGAVAEG